MSSKLVVASLAVPATFIAWRLLGSFLDNYFTRKLTALDDIKNLGPDHARPEGKRIRGTAVVCGGSIAGLWSALVASDHFENVLIIETETWVLTDEGTSDTYDEKGNYIENSREHTRSRVSQYHAQHAYQPITLQALKKYFPNIEDEILKANGVVSKYDLNFQTYGRRIFAVPDQSHLEGRSPNAFFVSRELYERILRRLVLNYSDRIRMKAGTVSGLNTVSGDPMTISFVSVRLPDGSTEEVSASLVIDCTGASQAGFKWLRRIAMDSANSDCLRRCVPSGAVSWDDLRLSYNVCQKFIRFRWPVPKDALCRLPVPGGIKNNPWLFAYFPVRGKEQKLFLISRIEGDRIDMSFSGWGEPPLPEDVSEIADWFRGLDQKVPDWFYPFLDILMEQKDKVEVSGSRYPSPSWIRYDKAPYVPHNFVAIGDAVLQPNPTYGQGCTKATIEAVTLDSVLKSQRIAELTNVPPNFGRDFFVKQSKRLRGVWGSAKQLDYQYRTTIPCKGEKLSDEWLMGLFGELITQMAVLDKEVDSVLYKVRSLLAPSTSLLTPYILSKMLLFQIRKKLGLVRL